MVVGLCPSWVVVSPETRLGERRRKKNQPFPGGCQHCSLLFVCLVCCLQPLVPSCFLPSQLLCMWVCEVCTTLQPSNQPATCKHALHTGSTRGCGQTCGTTAYDSTLTCRHVPCSWWVVCCTLDDVVKRICGWWAIWGGCFSLTCYRAKLVPAGSLRV